MAQRILVTGSAGFIGFSLARRLLDLGYEVFGIDNFNDYYDVRLKRSRHAILEKYTSYSYSETDISDKNELTKIFVDFKPEIVVNLAAQAGVRYSISNPDSYIKSNIVGFINILEACRNSLDKPRLLYASSSSVYGGTKEMPFSESFNVDRPISLYAATKKSNELMAHSYSHLYGFQTIGFRFFTVYGPWSRPDMATWLFADAMVSGRPIKVFNNGNMLRDFTYIDDIVSGLVKSIECDSMGLYDVFNIGNNKSERLMDLITIFSDYLKITPKMEFLPMQDGDVPATFASVDKLKKAVGYEPTTSIREGLPKFLDWFVGWKRENP